MSYIRILRKIYRDLCLKHNHENANKYFTKTELWFLQVATNFMELKEPEQWIGLESMCTDPPVSSVHTPSISDKKRVLLIGTNMESGFLKSHAESLLSVHGLIGADTTHNINAAGFWKKFFGQDDFVGKPKANTLPSLIITTGNIRNYRGSSETVHVGERLKDVAENWHVPIEFIKSLVYN